MKNNFFSLFLLLFCFSATAQDGLVSFLSFDNNDLIEESGNGQNGIFSSTTPSFTCGVKGQALSFNGTSDQLILFGLDNVLRTEDFTLSFYFKPEATLSTQVILAKREFCNPQNAMGLDYISTSNRLEYLFCENASKCLLFNENLDENVCWHHVVFVRESDVSKLYIDGILRREETTVTRVNIENDSELIFGGGPCLSASTVPFKGALDEIMVFNRALSVNEALSLYVQPNRITTQKDTLIFLGTSLNIEANETCANTFFWSPTDGVSSTTSAMPTIAPTETTVYTLEFDLGSCVAADSIRIKVVDPEDLDCNQIFLPTAFTPNDDGKNDTYGISNPFAVEELINFEIYDQWGGKVFATTDPFARWEGKNVKREFNSSGVITNETDRDVYNPNVFLYRVQYKCSGEENMLTGTVTLLR